jgi:hypothetical protein
MKWGKTMEIEINPDNRQYEIDELIGIKISLINALEQLDFLIDSMTECDCEDRCCQ